MTMNRSSVLTDVSDQPIVGRFISHGKRRGDNTVLAVFEKPNGVRYRAYVWCMDLERALGLENGSIK
jgi:hypothetical protein